MYRFETDIKTYILQNDMIRSGMKVLTGISGGADSVCLLLLLHRLSVQLGFELEAVHVEHGLRGAESLEDAWFTEELAHRLSIPIHTETVNVREWSRQRHLSTEEAARELRYQVFEVLADTIGADRIAVAHNRDDQAETVLMNLLRGSGLKGAAGIRPVRGRIIRPLLCVGRERIEDYLIKAGETWRTDSSNASTDYTRNKIRLEVLPYLKKEINAGTVQHLAALADVAAAADDDLQGQACEFLQRYMKREVQGTDKADADIKRDKEETMLTGTEMREWERLILPVDPLRVLTPIRCEYVLRGAIASLTGGRGLKDIGKVHLEDLCGLVFKGSGKRLDLPGYLKALRRHRELLLWIEK